MSQTTEEIVQSELDDYKFSPTNPDLDSVKAFSLTFQNAFGFVVDYPNELRILLDPAREFSVEEKLKIAECVIWASKHLICSQAKPQFLKHPRHRPKNSDRQGFIYLAKNNRSGLFKIGWSTQPTVREKTLQSEEPEVNIVRTWSGTMDVELQLHEEFSAQRVRGEWFRLSNGDLKLLEEICATLQIVEL